MFRQSYVKKPKAGRMGRDYIAEQRDDNMVNRKIKKKM
jgi:hypothetical protein